MPTFAPAKLAAWSGGRWTRSPGGALVGFNQDTRTLTAGQVFVALEADRRDGHDFLGEAQARGAAAAIVAREMAAVALPQLVVPDPLMAFQQIAGAHRREFFRGPVIGVTGSAGKTSTKDLLALLLGEGGPVSGRPGSQSETGSAIGPSRVLEAEGNLNKSDGAADATAPVRPTVLKTEGNLNNHIGVPLTLTRLDPAAHTAAVIEAGVSGPGEMGPLAGMIQPDHAIVTLVGPAHLERLGTVEGVAAEKAALLTAVRPGGWQVFPGSCWAFAAFRQLANPLVLVPVNEDMVQVGGRPVPFTVLHRPERTEVTLGGRRTFVLRRVSGGMAQNAALALALASELGVSDAQLQERLAGWQPSRWRGELQRVGEALVYCDFYNANPASMQDAIAAFSSLAKPERPRLYALGCMEELGAGAADYHRQLGRSLLLRPGDFAFIIGSQADAVREGLLENGNDPAQVAVITDIAPVRERLAGFKGAVFLKASRRYQLEKVLDPPVAPAAH
jgi:UDP-N-acetylmuramoyl-tripeptide--D-alanyl-D-alanine ligase